MTDDRGTHTRGDNASNDQHSSSTSGSSTASSSGSQTNRPQNASTTGERQQNPSTTGERQRSIQTSNEQSRAANQQVRGTGMTRGQQSAPGAYGATGSPFSLMRRMAEDMDRLFEDFGFGLPGFALSPAISSNPSLQRRGGSTNAFQRGWMPQIETFRRGDKLVLRADLPGLRKEDVNVEIEDGILTISGERSNENEEDRDGFYHSERSYGQFQRSLALPEGITGDSCEATFKDGVLEVTIPVPKQAEKSARKVQIR